MKKMELIDLSSEEPKRKSSEEKDPVKNANEQKEFEEDAVD